MKANYHKCHLLLSTQMEANIQFVLRCSKSKKLLAIIFNKHSRSIFQKLSRTLNALARLTKQMELPKVGILMSAFLKAQLSYFTVVWMSQTNSLNDKINPLLKSCLIIIYNDNFEEMLMKDNSSSIRHNNIHTLAVQM